MAKYSERFGAIRSMSFDHARQFARRARIDPRKIRRALRIWTLLVPMCMAMFARLEAQAGTATASLSVSIVITASCTIDAAALAFPPTSGTSLTTAAVSASSTISVTCTNGSPYSIAMDNGANASGSQRRMISGANFLSYNLYVDAAHAFPWSTAASNSSCTTSCDCFLGTGTGSAQSVSVYGVVPTTAIAPPPGSYNDTVTMTITY